MYNHIFIMGLWYVKNITGIEKMKVLPSKNGHIASLTEI